MVSLLVTILSNADDIIFAGITKGVLSRPLMVNPLEDPVFTAILVTHDPNLVSRWNNKAHLSLAIVVQTNSLRRPSDPIAFGRACHRRR